MSQGRKATNLSYIVNGGTRRQCLKKRMPSFLRAVEQLTTLCDLQACGILYDDERYKFIPKTFPDDPSQVADLVSKFKNLGVVDQTKKMLNHETYLTERIAKCCQQHNRLSDNNQETKLVQVMHQSFEEKNLSFSNLSVWDLVEFNNLVENQFQEVNFLISFKEASNHPLSLPFTPNISNPFGDLESNHGFVMPNVQDRFSFGVPSNHHFALPVSESVPNQPLDFISNQSLVMANAQEQFPFASTSNNPLSLPITTNVQSQSQDIGSDKGFAMSTLQDQHSFGVSSNHHLSLPIANASRGQPQDTRSNQDFVMANGQEQQVSFGFDNNNFVNQTDFNCNNGVGDHNNNDIDDDDQWFYDMMSKSHDAGVGSSNMSYANHEFR